MTKFFLSILLLSVLTTAKSQTKALTENGREVILYDNNTWKYTDSAETSGTVDSLAVNPTLFSKAPSATFLVKSNVFNVGVYIDPSKWTFSPRKDNDMTLEYQFELKTGSGYAMMVTEKTQIDLENLRQIALINAQKAAYDAKIVAAEYRTVNNKKMLKLEMRGTIKEIKFVYYGYYFSNSSGTVQLITFSTQELFDNTKNSLETFLNGLVEIKK